MTPTTRPVIREIRMAFSAGNRLASTIGGLMATIVPIMVFSVTHALPKIEWSTPTFWVLLVMAMGGGYFSMKSVILYGVRVFQGDKGKAVCYAFLLEGMLIMSGMREEFNWLGYAALGYLCFINTVSAGCAIAMEDKAFNSERRANNPRPIKRSKAKA